MTDTYRVRVGGGPWQTGDADEIDGVTVATEDGRLVFTTTETGEFAELEIDGLGAVRGSGPGAARVLGSSTEPFTFPDGAAMAIRVDGKARKLVLDAQDGASAATVARAINAKLRRALARPTGDGRVLLVSPTLGVGSSLAVEPPDGDAPDVAEVLGLSGANDEPYRSEPARLVWTPAPETVVLTNLTGAPVELQLPSGRVVLPARGSSELPRDAADDPLVRRLAEQGALRRGQAPS